MFLPRIQRLSLQPKLLTPKAQATLCFKHLTFVFVLANRRNCLVINQFLRTKGSTGTTKLIISFRKRVIWLVSLNNASYSVYCFLKSQCIFYLKFYCEFDEESLCLYPILCNQSNWYRHTVRGWAFSYEKGRPFLVGGGFGLGSFVASVFPGQF